jgi:hypothetical protein
MLAVLASRHDPLCTALAADWAADATLLTCADLSAAGWQYRPGGQVGTSRAGGRLAGAHHIDGVLTRLPFVAEGELTDIVPDDRSYVAAEMTAFLAAWLTDLPCPVLNRPTPVCLMGPYWRKEKWIVTASKLGIPVAPACRSVPGIVDNELCSGATIVNVVGRRCIGEADETLFRSALALAEAADVDLLRVRFASGEANSAFLEADCWVDIADPEVSAAILGCFAGVHSR